MKLLQATIIGIWVSFCASLANAASIYFVETSKLNSPLQPIFIQSCQNIAQSYNWLSTQPLHQNYLEVTTNSQLKATSSNSKKSRNRDTQQDNFIRILAIGFLSMRILNNNPTTANSNDF